MKRLSIFFLVLGLTGCPGLPPGWDDPPTVARVTPNDGDDNVPIGTRVNAVLDLPNGGVNLTTVNEQSVRLVDAATGVVVNAEVDVSNDTESLTLTPTDELRFSTEYRFEITSAVEDESSAAFDDYSSTFTTVSSDVPSVSRTRPANGERNVDVRLPNGISTDLTRPIARTTLTENSVYLTNLDTGQRVAGSLGTSGGDDTISFNPTEVLEPFTEYQFSITSAVTSQDGVPFLPYTSTFTTGEEGGSGTSPNIEQVAQPAAARVRHSSLAFGPDGDLYATTILGEIRRYPVAPNGTLGTPTIINSLIEHEGGRPRLTIGLAFDPASTASNPIVWVTHTYIDLSYFAGGVERGIDAPWAGKLTRLSGPNLENVEDVVVNLPRSNKDHVTNSVAFNPAEPGVVYFVQGSNTAMGAPDNAWGSQGERALTGAVLRLDTDLLGSLPLDAKTEDGGTYDPFAPNAPLTVYASGTRNSYDLVWHSNGNLYVPANGSARGGIVPRYNPQLALPGFCETRIDGRPYTGEMLSDPSALDDYTTTIAEGETDGWVIGETQNDYLFNIEEGGYYGTPNPKRCEWILNGGGGSNRESSANVPDYPAAVEPDPNYRGFAFDFGQGISPNGAIEYRGDAFSDLRGKLLVTRYSNGDDLVAVELDGAGNGTSATFMGKFLDPIDIAEDPNTGYLYVSEYAERSGAAATKAGIFLLRPR